MRSLRCAEHPAIEATDNDQIAELAGPHSETCVKNASAGRQLTLLGKLGGEDVDRLDHGRLREEFRGLRLERLRHPAGKMGLPAGIVWNASKIAKVDGPVLTANQAIVPGSCSTIGRPPRRKFSTSVSFPAFASSRTNSALATIAALL